MRSLQKSVSAANRVEKPLELKTADSAAGTKRHFCRAVL
jgi:hypothetical protein